MGKLKSIEIIFENNKSVYYPGECLNGNIVVESRGEIRINALKVFIRGLGKVHWTETKTAGYRLGNYTEHYRSEVEYVSLKQTLIGGNGNSGQAIIKEFVCDGFHVFPFSFTLPRMRMVTSFEGKHGSIRYFVIVELDKRWALNYKLKKLFTLINPVDINQREYLAPVFNDASKAVCCWFCKSGPISINVRTDRRGYCPGESIMLNALFENNSNRSVTPTATLYQLQTYNNANGKHLVATNKLVTINGTCIAPSSLNEWTCKTLKIPAVSPSINSVLIRVEYFVKVAMLIPGSYSLSCTLPLIIGTIPLRHCIPSSLYQAIPSTVISNIGQNTTTRIDPPPSYSELENLTNHTKTTNKTDSKDLDQKNEDSNDFPLYTYVQDYVIPPPYSRV